MMILGPITAAVDTAALAAQVATAISAGGVQITVSSPVAADGEITLVRGDSYRLQDGRAITFAVTGLALDGAGAVLHLASQTDGSVVQFVGAFAGSAAVFELTSSQTQNLHVGARAYGYRLQITLGNGSIVVAAVGSVRVRRDA